MSKVYALGVILERAQSVDKDLRYMAISDLMNEVERGDISMDVDSDAKISRNLLQLLEDKSAEVQNLVIRCIGFMVYKWSSSTMISFLATNCINMIPSKNGEIYCTALKTVTSQVKAEKESTKVVQDVYPKIVELLNKVDEGLASELMDICSDLLLRFGSKLNQHHQPTLDSICAWVQKGRSMVRKRATMALGSLTASCNNEIFKMAVENIFKWLDSKPTDQGKLRNYVMSLNFVCRSRGNQFAMFLQEALPRLIEICNETEDDDTREGVITTFETFLYFCGGNIATHQPDIQKVLLKYLSHDPNYCVDEEDEEMEAQDADDEDDEENQYSDSDDDISWKVRRACAKALATEVKYLDNTGKKLLNWMTSVAPKLVDRLRDREDHVLIEIINALKEMTVQVNKSLPEQGIKNVDSFGDISGESEISEEQKVIQNQLEDLYTRMNRGLTNLIQRKTTITRSAAFELLIELTRTLPNQFTADFVLVAARAGLDDKNGGSAIKMLVLQFITSVFKTHEPNIFIEYVPQLTEMMVQAVDDKFYKIVSEAINVLSLFSVILRKSKDLNPTATTQHINNLYNVLEQLLQKTHDQEVHHRAIKTTGVYLGTLVDQPSPKEENLLKLLIGISERNGIDQNTMIAALSALKTVAENSQAQLIMAPHLDSIIGNLAILTEKYGGNLGTRVRDSVSDLQNIILELAVTSFNDQRLDTGSDNVKRLIAALPTLLNDSDLLVAQKCLQAMTASIKRGLVADNFLPALVRLFESHLLNGNTLQAAINTVSILSKEQIKNGKLFEEFVDEFTAPVFNEKSISSSACRNTARATAAIVAACADKDKNLKLLNQLIGQLNSTESNLRLFSTVAIGELGRVLSDISDESIPQRLLEICRNVADELRTVAAQSLGAMAAGNPERYMPFILSNLERDQAAQLPLLHAIKEVLLSRKLEKGDFEKIWPVLVAHSDAQEESVRAIVADCMGKICDDLPEQGLAALQNLLAGDRENVRYTAITSLKVIVFDASNIKNKMLLPHLDSIGTAISDQDIRIRRIGLIVLNALFYKRTQLMRAHVKNILPAVYIQSKVVPELIREVEMGPFKHQVDDGVDVRKAAYECLLTIIEKCSPEVNMDEFIIQIQDGLKDSNHDIKHLTGMILSRLCILAPGPLLRNITPFTELIKSLLSTKPKSNAVRQEIEKIDEMKKAVLRVVRSMQKIPDSDRHLVEITSFISLNKDIQLLNEGIKDEPMEQ